MSDTLTKAVIEKAFDLMGELAASTGEVLDIAVFGGSCLVLATNIREASGDVDSVFLSNRRRANEIADIVAGKLGISRDWINEAVRRLAPPPGNPEPNLLPYGDYPRNNTSGVGLRVYLPTPEYMLAMKILAQRDQADVEKTQSDKDDAVGLMEITDLYTKDQLISLIEHCYPQLPGMVINDKLNARIEAKIDSYVDAYNEFRSEEVSHNATRKLPTPTWNARRSRQITGRER